jgi:DNA replication protein DnaC
LTPTLRETLASFPRLTPPTPEEAARREAEKAREEAEEQARRRAALVAGIEKDLGPRYAARRTSLESFQVYHPAQQEVLKKLRSLDLANVVARGEGLIFFGPVGTGKDHLAAAMLYLAATRHELRGRWINGQEWFGTMRDRMGEGQSEEGILRDLAQPAILAISDPIPPRRDPSPWNVEMLYRLIDRRYRLLKSTWVTLNVASLDEADNRLTAPVFDRLRESAHFIKCFWPSYREHQKSGTLTTEVEAAVRTM